MTQPICEVCGESVRAVVETERGWSCIVHLPPVQCDRCYVVARPIGIEQFMVGTAWSSEYALQQSIGYRCPQGHLSHRDGGMGPGFGKPKAPPRVFAEMAVYVDGERVEEG